MEAGALSAGHHRCRKATESRGETHTHIRSTHTQVLIHTHMHTHTHTMSQSCCGHRVGGEREGGKKWKKRRVEMNECVCLESGFIRATKRNTGSRASLISLHCRKRGGMSYCGEISRAETHTHTHTHTHTLPSWLSCPPLPLPQKKKRQCYTCRI